MRPGRVVLDAEPPWTETPPARGPRRPKRRASARAVAFSTTVSAGETWYTCRLVLSAASTSSAATPGAFVAAYSLSRKPWCHVFTE
ncbi:hypothetical protein KEM52_003034 [Ascosphaera acerosa]|nr:hypothetical protein KEM52_003034 [Ascosphaera acerosa]